MTDDFRDDDADEPKEEAPLQFDIFGQKLHINPQADAYQPPRSWREVGARTNRALMTLVAQLIELPTAVLVGANNLVSGIPAMFTRRVENAHDAADRAESERQEQLVVANPSHFEPHEQPASSIVLHDLAGLLDEFRASGLCVEIRQLDNGRIGVYILPADQIEPAHEIIESEVLPALDRGRRGDASLKSLDLSRRVFSALDQAGITTVDALTERTAEQLLALKNFGRAALEEVRAALAVRGLRLAGE